MLITDVTYNLNIPTKNVMYLVYNLKIKTYNVSAIHFTLVKF